jgi:two-component system cell cycle response regulator
MQNDAAHDARKAVFDTNLTLVVRIDEAGPAGDSSSGRAPRPLEHPLEEAAPRRRDTPLLPPAPSSVPGSARATLTILTGLQAGRLVTVDETPVTIGRAPDADMMVDETGVSRHHARIARTPDGGFCVEDLASTNGTFVGAERVEVQPLHGGELLKFGPLLQVRFAMVDSVEESLYRKLYESSVRDPLTHVFNRRYLTDRMLAEIARARRAKSDVAVLMLDVDCLKGVNDAFGHLAGDRALCTVAARILRALRLEDLLARYGGDEFVVLAIGTDGHHAELLAERIRRTVEGLHLSARGHDVRITASIGIATLAEVDASDEPVTALLSLADSRMYCAKKSGKNRVCFSSPPPGASSVSER